MPLLPIRKVLPKPKCFLSAFFRFAQYFAARAPWAKSFEHVWQRWSERASHLEQGNALSVSGQGSWAEINVKLWGGNESDWLRGQDLGPSLGPGPGTTPGSIQKSFYVQNTAPQGKIFKM